MFRVLYWGSMYFISLTYLDCFNHIFGDNYLLTNEDGRGTYEADDGRRGRGWATSEGTGERGGCGKEAREKACESGWAASDVTRNV